MTVMTPQEIASIALANAARRPTLSATAARTRKEASLVTLTRDGSRYWRLELKPPADFAALYTSPAQYITLQIGEMEPRFVALASSPHEPHWHFLIDQDSTLGRAASSASTLPLIVSAPEGKGFTLPSGAPLVLFTTGSGIATMRGVLAWLAEHHTTQLEQTYLYYGERDPVAAAYKEELDAWRARGLHVRMAFDHPPEGHTWRFVQQPFEADTPARVLEHGTFLMSGSAIMLRFVSEMLLKRGVSPERLLFNV